MKWTQTVPKMGRAVLPRPLLSLLLVFCASTLFAQPVQIQVASSGSVRTVANGSTVDLPAQFIGDTATITISIVNSSAGPTTITRIELSGGAQFTLQSNGSVPATLGPGALLSCTVRYQANSGRSLQAILLVGVSDDKGAASLVSLGLTGTAPDWLASYSATTDAVARPVVNGSPIELPAVALYSLTQVSFTLTNTGSGAGTLNSVRLSGDTLQLSNLPLLPTAIAPGQSISFGIRSTPPALGIYTGVLSIATSSWSWQLPVSVVGRSFALSYQLLTNNGVQLLSSGATLAFPDTVIGSGAMVRLRILNETGGLVQLNTLNLSGASEIQLVTAVATPLILTDGSYQDLAFTFQPTRAGSFNVRLQVNGDALLLSGLGLTAPLALWQETPQGLSPLGIGTTISIGATPVATTSSIVVVVQNVTTQPIRLNRISVTDPNHVFQLALSSLTSAVVEPQQQVRLVLQFAPSNIGPASAIVSLDTWSFTLQGYGTAPATFPSATIDVTGGSNIAVLQQPAVSVKLVHPYTLDLVGTLILTPNNGALPLDPAVQFSTGGQKVLFTIPAGATQAIFANGTSQIRLQTGSVAGELLLTGSFQTRSGLDLGGNGAMRTLILSGEVPQILSAQVTYLAASGYQLEIIGLASTRTLTSAELQLKSTGLMALSGLSQSLDLQREAKNWYQSSASQTAGGIFRVSIPLGLSLSDPPTGSTLTLKDVVKEIAVRLRNDLGPSLVVTASVP